MSLFDAMLLDVVLILFPLNVCLLYQTYKRSIDNPENDIYLDLALISMLYLLLRFGIFEYKYITYFIVNIPLVIAFLKGREVIFILISIILISLDSDVFILVSLRLFSKILLKLLYVSELEDNVCLKL